MRATPRRVQVVEGLHSDVLLPLVEAEVEQRRCLAREAVESCAAAGRRFYCELGFLIAEQGAAIQIKETNFRAIETDAFSWQRVAQRFYWSRHGASLLLSCELAHRNVAALLWMEESVCRRQLISASYGVETGTVAVPVKTTAPQMQLHELKADRQRGIFAAHLNDLVIHHDSTRSRLEWAETEARSQITMTWLSKRSGR